MLYNWVCDCHGNTCYLILIVFFCMIHSIGPIKVCTDSEIELGKHYLKNGTSYVMGAGYC